MSKLFLFIDESGDPGNGRDSSKYYQINILAANHEGMVAINEAVSTMRYFLGSGRELKEYWSHRKIKKKLRELVELTLIKCSESKEMRALVFRVEKENYTGPYLGESGKRFRNFILKESLRQLFERINHNSYHSIEVVIDRYLESEEDQSNLKQYLKTKYDLPRSPGSFHSKITHLIHVQSIYSEQIQFTDLIGKFANKCLKNEVIKIIDISTIKKPSSK
jgi:hypothetical protein